MSKDKPLFNVFIGESVLVQNVTVTIDGDTATLKGVGKRQWVQRVVPKSAITRKVKVSA
jgi:hypothetical protein